MKIKKIKIREKLIEAEECASIFEKARGLMFRGKSMPLLFKFNKPGMHPIHSFFCRKFLAVWIKKGRVIDEKIVKPFSFYVVPKKKFDCLVEIPITSQNKKFILRRGDRKV